MSRCGSELVLAYSGWLLRESYRLLRVAGVWGRRWAGVGVVVVAMVVKAVGARPPHACSWSTAVANGLEAASAHPIWPVVVPVFSRPPSPSR
jgi:hypothetical protein